MSPIRVLVVDDSVVVRRLVSDALAESPGIEVVGVASNGKLALERMEQLKPDLVTLDVEMPVMDGLETLKALRERWPRLPVIMFSTLTERGGRITLEALQRGASDYVTKPANVGSVMLARERVRDELVPRIHALTGRVAPQAATPQPRPTPTTPVPRGPVRPPKMLLIGASTGGPNALATLFAALPPLRVPMAIVQHMPPVFTALLADRLAAGSAHEVTEGASGTVLRAGSAVIAPGGRHLAIGGTTARPEVHVTDAPPENSCRPSVDVLFRTAATSLGGAVLAVVLTGMGEDGSRGARAIREAGGEVLVQDEASSVVWGMPGAVSRAGLADGTHSLDRLAAVISERVGVTTEMAHR